MQPWGFPLSRWHAARIPDMGTSKRACQEFTLFGKNEHLRTCLLEGVILSQTWCGGGGKPLDTSCGFQIYIYIYIFIMELLWAISRVARLTLFSGTTALQIYRVQVSHFCVSLLVSLSMQV